MSLLNDASWVLIPSGIKEDVIYAQKPSSGLGDLNFQRASDATYTDASGVVRRSPYNLFTFSEQFDNAVFTKVGGSVVANNGEDPNGLMNADTFTADGANSTHRLFQSISLNSGNTFTASVFVKKGTSNFVQLAISGAAAVGNTNFANFDIENGVLGSTGGSQVNNTITNFGNGWYRISSTITTIGTGTAQVDVVIIQSANSVRFQNWSTSASVLIYGIQLVEGSSALDYFPTTNRQDVPRIDFRNADGTLSSCGRLLLEPQRTNSIRNSSMVGAVAGTPGTLPTNWENSVTSGLTRTIVGVGTENGLPYVDFRFSGTTSGTSVRIDFESATQIAALNAQTWTQSIYAKILSAPNPPLNYNLTIIERTSGGSFVASGFQAIVPTSSLQRFNFTRTLNGGAIVGAAQPSISINTNTATAYDFTIRIAAPQMELGAYATTWVPTTTAAVTRIADLASKTGVSSIIGQTEGTIFVEGSISGIAGNIKRVFSLSDGTANNEIMIQNTSNNTAMQFVVTQGGVGQVSIVLNLGNMQFGVNFKVAFAYKQNDFVAYFNGTQVGTDTVGTVPTCSKIVFGRGNDLTLHEGTINQAALFPTRLTNAQLAQLTTL